LYFPEPTQPVVIPAITIPTPIARIPSSPVISSPCLAWRRRVDSSIDVRGDERHIPRNDFKEAGYFLRPDLAPGNSN
jgi:hypothetical protein